MPLKMLKPRVETVKQGRIATSSGTWRADKTSAQRGYGYRWQKARERFLRANPLCCYCQANGYVTSASVVDHVIPHRGDKRLFWDESNWQALCASCHSSVKQKEEARA